MGAVRVTTPAGSTWTVRRRWTPHRERNLRDRFRRRRPDSDGLLDALDVAADAGDLPVLGAVAVVVAVFLAILLLAIWFPFVILLVVDIVWLVLAGVIGVIGRVLLRRPWQVEARSSDERRHWYVPGFRAAGRHRDEIARQFRHGQNPLGEAPSPVPH